MHHIVCVREGEMSSFFMLVVKEIVSSVHAFHLFFFQDKYKRTRKYVSIVPGTASTTEQQFCLMVSLFCSFCMLAVDVLVKRG